MERLRSDPYSCVIRGRLKEGLDPSKVRRKLLGSDPSFEPQGRLWLCVDLDSLPSPDFLGRPGEALERLRCGFPDGFRGASFFWTASGSAGKKPGIRAHLWFWLNRAVTEGELKALYPKGQWGQYQVDASLFRPVQLHYTADPLFEDPSEDPMQQRSGLSVGASEKAAVPSPPPEIPASLETLSDRALKAAKGKLAGAVQRVLDAPEGDRRNTLYRMAFREGCTSPLEDAEIRRALLGAGHQFPDLSTEQVLAQVDSGLAQGRAKASAPWREGLQYTEDGAICLNQHNLQRILERHPETAGLFAKNTRTGALILTRDPPWEKIERSYPCELKNADFSWSCEWFSKLKLFPSAVTIAPAMTAVCDSRPFDPVEDYLQGLQEWDGKERLGQWLVALAGAEDSEYVRAVGRKWLISAIARADVPGCQADYMLVFVGETGLKKSSLLRALVPSAEWFDDRLPDVDSKDALQKLSGPWILEWSEMSGASKKEVNAVKAFLTARVDKYRAPYERVVESHPRKMVFAGSTNDEQFLHDVTGGRRFWPVKTGLSDLTKASEWRDQLWSEAKAAYLAGEAWHFEPEEEARLVQPHQEAAREADPWEDMLREALFLGYDRLRVPKFGSKPRADEGQLDAGLFQYLRTDQALALVGGDPSRDADSRKVWRALRALGWRNRAPGGVRAWYPGYGFYPQWAREKMARVEKKALQ